MIINLLSILRNVFPNKFLYHSSFDVINQDNSIII